jgi:hypothetical protein
MMHCEEFRGQACAADGAQESHLPCATREPKPTIVNDPSLLRRCALEVKSLRLGLAADMIRISVAHKYTDFHSRFDHLEHANIGQSTCAGPRRDRVDVGASAVMSHGRQCKYCFILSPALRQRSGEGKMRSCCEGHMSL